MFINESSTKQVHAHVFLQNDESPVVQGSIKGLEKVFCHWISNGLLSEKGPVLEAPAEQQVRVWTCERYKEFQERLFTLIAEAEQISLQEQSLITLMHLLQVEGQTDQHTSGQVVEEKKHLFPLTLLEVGLFQCYQVLFSFYLFI